MPLYKEENYLVVHPGSEWTLFTYGLLDLLSPPQYKIPSVVYVQEKNEAKQYQASPADGYVKVQPIIDGRLVDVDAFNYLLKVILQTIIKNHPVATISLIPLLLVVPALLWLRELVEYVTKFVVETLEFTAFNIIDLALAATFGIGLATNAVVINVGANNVQIVPVVGYQAVRFASKYIAGVGGSTINAELAKALPQLLEQQIEDLKCLDVVEVLTDAQAQAFYQAAESKAHPAKPDEDDDFDVAKIVTDEAELGAVTGKANNEMEKNYFIDSVTGEKIIVGLERFQGTDTLVEALVDPIYECLEQIPDLDKRQECYDSIILVGLTFKIPGLKQQLLLRLLQKYLVTEPQSPEKKALTINSAIAAYQQTEDVDMNDNSHLAQVPHLIRLAKYPDYFSEWKKYAKNPSRLVWSDVYFLGAQIYAKQIFNSNSNHGKELFIDTDLYGERGPQAIWDVCV